MSAEDIIARQVQMYGEPLSVRFRRLLEAYRIPQTRLAAVIGLSPPMLSQLMSGQREKISNPAVLGRIVRLEELARAGAATQGPALDALLDQVAASRPELSTRSMDALRESPADRAAAALAEAVDAEALRAAAKRLKGGPVQAIVARAADLASAG